jgi:MYXO-CTERM domain-containing protein
MSIVCTALRASAVTAIALAFTGAPAHAGVYFTVYTLNTPYTVTSPDVTQVMMSWSTNLTNGIVQQGDLTDWSISFLNGGNLFYTDNIVAAGAVRSIGGVNRGIADIAFNFNLDTLTAGEFDNMLQGVLLAGASGPAYNIYSYPQGPFDPPYSTLGIWANGNESTRELPGYSSVFTVPAPGAFAALAFAGLASHRRRRN